VQDSESPRLARERRTVEAMIGLYCRAQHGGAHVPCEACAELLAYAQARLDGCPYAEDKPTCSHCAVHCYKPSMRERIRAVMRYAGPRMLRQHPVLAVLHLVDGLRKGYPRA
jgi:hypothetical protein